MAEAQPPLESDLPVDSIGKKSASGIMWTTALNIGGRALSNLISQLVLARVLLPEDFGVVGLAYTISGFFSVLTGFGIEQVFQQRRPRMHMWATQAFALSLGLATTVAVAMAVYAPIGARLYHNPEVTKLVWVVALSLPLSALGTVPTAQLKSLLRFKFLAVYSSIELIASQTLTVALALYGMGALSFVLPLPLAALIRAIVFWRVAPMHLRPRRRARGWRRMMSRGVAAFGVSIVNTSIGQGDYVTLGLIAPAPVVGIYYFAFKLAAQPVMLLAGNFMGVLRPALVAMSGDPTRQCNAALKTGKLLGLLTAPLCLMQAAVAEPLLHLLFGERWNASIPLVQILSLGLSIDSVAWAAGAFLESRGQFSKSFTYQLITMPFFFIFVGAGGLLASATGVALGVAAYYLSHPVFLTTIVFRKAGVGWRRILSCFYVPLGLAGPTIGGSYLVGRLPVFDGMELVHIAIPLALGGPLYLLAVRLVTPELFGEVLAKIPGPWRKR
ncbi:MAG: oligosaccharide flippase family protein [Alphaproteobacteria bacterium]|nr:oligosaccharide flippase family protein [Alphaproteobacteria bacterium]